MLSVLLHILYGFFAIITFIISVFVIKIKDYGKPVCHQIDPTGVGLFTILFSLIAGLLWPAIPFIIAVYYLNNGINKVVKTYMEYMDKIKKND